MRFVCQRNRDGSYATIANREHSLQLMGRQLEELGFRQLKRAEQLKPKHVWALIGRWQDEGIAAATIKNRMSHLRWLAAKTDNRSLVARDNDHYGINRRQYVTNESKALQFDNERIARIEDRHVQLSAELQREFGLRREEAMKLIPHQAHQDQKLVLQGSWCKGGKPREIPIRTDAQRDLLSRAKTLVGQRSMIPPERSYVHHLRVFERSMNRVGLGRSHGARHMYAQQLYEALSGQLPPALGGISRKQMSPSERAKDDEIRLTISREMGHERLQIVAIYIGS